MTDREELWLEGGAVRFVYTDAYVDKLIAERDAALVALELSNAIVAADGALITGLKSDVEQLKSALREAKEALSSCRDGVEFTRQYIGYGMLPAIVGWSWFDADQSAHKAIATINEVLKEE